MSNAPVSRDRADAADANPIKPHRGSTDGAIPNRTADSNRHVGAIRHNCIEMQPLEGPAISARDYLRIALAPHHEWKAYARFSRLLNRLTILFFFLLITPCIGSLPLVYLTPKQPLIGKWYGIVWGVSLMTTIVAANIIGRRQRRTQYRLIESGSCLNCAKHRSEFLERCWYCASEFAEQDRFRRARRHMAARGGQPGCESFKKLVRTQTTLVFMVIGAWVVGSVMLIPVLPKSGPIALLAGVLGPISLVSGVWIPLPLSEKRYRNPIRNELLDYRGKCLNCGKDIAGLSDDAFCAHCDASLLWRRRILDGYGIDESPSEPAA